MSFCGTLLTKKKKKKKKNQTNIAKYVVVAYAVLPTVYSGRKVHK
jgi:hypothetical protein